jgi:hypothetical protein
VGINIIFQYKDGTFGLGSLEPVSTMNLCGISEGSEKSSRKGTRQGQDTHIEADILVPASAVVTCSLIIADPHDVHLSISPKTNGPYPSGTPSRLDLSPSSFDESKREVHLPPTTYPISPG